MKITLPPTYNMEVGFGGMDTETNIYPVEISMNVKRTLVNRFKYWMLCHFFPFNIKYWNN